MGDRYPIPGLKATWFAPRGRKFLKGKGFAVAIRMVDISVAGALIETAHNPNIKVGSRLEWELNGCAGVVEVRNCRQEDDKCYYGVSYFRMDGDQKALVHKVVAKVREDNNLTTQWEHRKF